MSEPIRSFNPGERIAASDELGVGDSKVAPIVYGDRNEEVILLRTEEGYVSYLNRCRHLPIPLDWGDGDVMDDSGKLFLCRTHGALYRPKDGLCVSGPCRGLSLLPIEIAVEPDGVYLSESATPS